MKSIHDTDDVIAALSTPPGGSGRAIVRLSGVKAFSVLGKMFKAEADAEKISGVVNGALTLEESCRVPCSVYYMPGPKSYTRQDVAEIHLPGSPALAEMTMQACLQNGARRAEAGEFTLRAFLNGRIDLAQAEAVEAMIAAAGERERRAALERLDGAFSHTIIEWRTALIEAIAQVEGELDFEEDEFAPLPGSEIADKIREVLCGLDSLLADCGARDFEEGSIPVLFAGLTNAGKSSLINALLGHDEAVVSPERSTTRDRLDFKFTVEPFHFILSDSPGLDLSDNDFARMSSENALRQGRTAGVVALIVDGSHPIDNDLNGLLSDMPEVILLPVINKCDCEQQISSANIFQFLEQKLPGHFSAKLVRQPISLSAVSGEGLEEFRSELLEIAAGDMERSPSGSTLNYRMIEELHTARSHLEEAIKLLEGGIAHELSAEELRSAFGSLGHVVGVGYAEEVLESIFSRFCIGK